MMPVGPISMTILLVLILFGFLERVLADMGLTPRLAALLAVAVLLGSAVELPLARGLAVNVGAGLLPLAVVAYLLWHADEWQERVRGLLAGVVTALAVYLVERVFPNGQPTELNLFQMDAQYLYGLVAALVGYLAGRSRRCAFCAGVLGVIFGDLAAYGARLLSHTPSPQPILVGGGAIWDTALLAGVVAVLLGELIGEPREVPRDESQAGG